jgi:hypothetical protein
MRRIQQRDLHNKNSLETFSEFPMAYLRVPRGKELEYRPLGIQRMSLKLINLKLDEN